MKKYVWMVIAALLVVSLGVAGFSYAAPGRGDRGGQGCSGQEWGPGGGDGFGPSGGHNGRGMARYLDLTKEQTDKLTDLRKKHFEEMKPVRDELFQKRQEMKQLFADPQAKEEAILAKQKEISGLHQKMSEKAMQFRLDARKVLTPEQLKKMGEFKPKFGHHGKGRCRG
jgi:Spy/CpxP family protein refolding chaperone